ncbi:hypothetical protein BDY19DRAFT_361121 [Irpex rosettiformis]|uniref:Uncharacterized protein n=1 Tax=Irpex rosettiformis TaxID=378272 RepID=A0ACB8TWV5_9APHY|nr:hypothetical protein BDY19DRAFT_361121 [Irpex rosettiformis]
MVHARSTRHPIPLQAPASRNGVDIYIDITTHTDCAAIFGEYTYTLFFCLVSHKRGNSMPPKPLRARPGESVSQRPPKKEGEISRGRRRFFEFYNSELLSLSPSQVVCVLTAHSRLVAHREAFLPFIPRKVRWAKRSLKFDCARFGYSDQLFVIRTIDMSGRGCFKCGGCKCLMRR